MTINVTDASFEAEIVDSELPVLVDFWAPWCGPCKAMAPTFDELAAENAATVKFAKVNVDATSVASQFQIRGIPTLVLVKHGCEVARLVGNQTKQQIVDFLAANQ